MARSRKRKVPVKRRNEHQRVADAGIHSAADLKQHHGYQHETMLKQQQLPDELPKCEYCQSLVCERSICPNVTECKGTQNAGYDIGEEKHTFSDELDNSSVEQCQFSDGLASFNDKLMQLEIKEQHIRTLLGTRFNEESFFSYRQGVINEAISILHLSTKEDIAELSKLDIPEQQEELEDTFLSSTESSKQFSQELFGEIKKRIVNAFFSLKRNECKLIETFGELGRKDYADSFMERVIETERERWDIDVMHMNKIVEEANMEYLNCIGFYNTEQVFESNSICENVTEFVREVSHESLGELYAETLQTQHSVCDVTGKENLEQQVYSSPICIYDPSESNIDVILLNNAVSIFSIFPTHTHPYVFLRIRQILHAIETMQYELEDLRFTLSDSLLDMLVERIVMRSSHLGYEYIFHLKYDKKYIFREISIGMFFDVFMAIAEVVRVLGTADLNCNEMSRLQQHFGRLQTTGCRLEYC